MLKKFIAILAITSFITACDSSNRHDDSISEQKSVVIKVSVDDSDQTVECDKDFSFSVSAYNCLANKCSITVSEATDDITVVTTDTSADFTGHIKTANCEAIKSSPLKIDVTACDSSDTTNCGTGIVTLTIADAAGGTGGNGGNVGGGGGTGGLDKGIKITGVEPAVLTCGSNAPSTKIAMDLYCPSGTASCHVTFDPALPTGLGYKITGKNLYLTGKINDYKTCVDISDTSFNVNACDSLSALCETSSFTLKTKEKELGFDPAICMFRVDATAACELKPTGGSGSYTINSTDLPAGLVINGSKLEGKLSSLADSEIDLTIKDALTGNSIAGKVTVKGTDKITIRAFNGTTEFVTGEIKNTQINLSAEGGTTACGPTGGWSWEVIEGDVVNENVEGTTNAQILKVNDAKKNILIARISVLAKCGGEEATLTLENVTFKVLATVIATKVTYKGIEDAELLEVLKADAAKVTVDLNQEIAVELSVTDLATGKKLSIEAGKGCTLIDKTDSEPYILKCTFSYSADHADVVINFSYGTETVKTFTFGMNVGNVVTSIRVKHKTGTHTWSDTDAEITIKFCPTNTFDSGCTDEKKLDMQDHDDRGTGLIDEYTLNVSEIATGEKSKQDLRYFIITNNGGGKKGPGWLMEGIEVWFKHADGKEDLYYVNPCTLRWIEEGYPAKFGPDDAAVCAVITTAKLGNGGTDDNVYLNFKREDTIDISDQSDSPPYFRKSAGLYMLHMDWDSGTDTWYRYDKYNDFEQGFKTSYGSFIFNGKALLDTIDDSITISKDGDDKWALGAYEIYLYNPTDTKSCRSTITTLADPTWLDDEGTLSANVTGFNNDESKCSVLNSLDSGIGSHD